MGFKFEYNKTYTSEDYLNNRDDFIKAMNKKCSICNMDGLMKFSIVDSFAIDKDGFVSLNCNDEKIENLVKEWKN